MAQKDKIKWDKKYQETPKLLEERQPSNKLQNVVSLIKGKKALEIACGAGRNSIYLACQGFDVEALDISSVALENLDLKGYENISTKEVDLEGYTPLKDSYDLVVMTNYLDREIIPKLYDALKQDGILVIETYMDHPSNTKPNSNPDFLLKAGELKTFFDSSSKLLDYEEFDNDLDELYRMKKQAIVIQKL